MAFVQEYVFRSLASHGAPRNSECRWFELDVFRFQRIILVCPKSIGSFHSESTQVSELIDGLDFMVVLRHVIGLPQRFWLQHNILTERWCRPTLCGVVRNILLVGRLDWPGFLVAIVVVGVGLVRSSRSLRPRGIRLRGLVDPVVGGSVMVAVIAGGIRLTGIRSPGRFVPGWP